MGFSFNTFLTRDLHFDSLTGQRSNDITVDGTPVMPSVFKIRRDLILGEGNHTYFGREFLANMYLYVDYDRDEFTLVQASATTSNEDLVTLDEAHIERRQFCTRTNTTISAARDTNTTPPELSEKDGLSPTIIGVTISISILAGTAVLAAVIWQVLKKTGLWQRLNGKKTDVKEVKSIEEDPNWGKKHKPCELAADSESEWAVPPPILAEAIGDEGRRLKRGCACACSCETWVEDLPEEMPDGQGRPVEMSHSPRCQRRRFEILR